MRSVQPCCGHGIANPMQPQNGTAVNPNAMAASPNGCDSPTRGAFLIPRLDEIRPGRVAGHFNDGMTRLMTTGISGFDIDLEGAALQI